MQQQVIITRGIPASGKSTWAKQKVREDSSFKRINKDDLRAMLDGGKYSKKNEETVLKVRDTLLVQFLYDGYSIIIDDTNLHKNHINRIEELVYIFNSGYKEEKAEVTQKWFPIHPKNAIERDVGREASVGASVIHRMYKDYVAAGGEEVEYVDEELKSSKVPVDINLPFCIVADLDGTLANFKNKGHRGPFDASNCDEDDLDFAVSSLLNMVEDSIYFVPLGEGKGLCPQIIFLSGRDSKYRAPTERFLSKHGYGEYPLYMRAENDNRDDRIIKQELYEQHIKGKYNVLFILDDRKKVVDMWRSLGLKCFQVEPGNF